MQDQARRSFTSGLPLEVVHLRNQGTTFFSSAASKKGPVGFRRKLQILVLIHELKTTLPGGVLERRIKRRGHSPQVYSAEFREAARPVAAASQIWTYNPPSTYDEGHVLGPSPVPNGKPYF